MWTRFILKTSIAEQFPGYYMAIYFECDEDTAIKLFKARFNLISEQYFMTGFTTPGITNVEEYSYYDSYFKRDAKIRVFTASELFNMIVEIDEDMACEAPF